jgi:hypothetical protein
MLDVNKRTNEKNKTAAMHFLEVFAGYTTMDHKQNEDIREKLGINVRSQKPQKNGYSIWKECMKTESYN